MLDKSVPYIDIVMRRPAMQPPAAPVLPEGYRFVLFGEEGCPDKSCMRNWAGIETSVLEFPDEQAAEEYFLREFMPYIDEVRERMIFIVSPEGKKVGTATAWRKNFNGLHTPWVHWVAVKPQYQGQGLGHAIISETIRLLYKKHGYRDYYLHTQTWSHKAVLLYESAGFEITIPDPPVCVYSAERLDEALEIINRFRRPDIKK